MKPDVLIIGGGVIGLSIARELRLAGVKRVKVLERGVCGEEASWAAAGMLSPHVEAGSNDAFYDLCSRSRDLYPEFSTDLLAETGVDIRLDTAGSLKLAFDEAALDGVEGDTGERLSAAEVRS